MGSKTPLQQRLRAALQQRAQARPAPQQQPAVETTGASPAPDLRGRLARAERELAQWKSKAQQLETEARQQKIRAALLSAVSAAGAIEPEDAVELLLAKQPKLEGETVVFGEGESSKTATEYAAEWLESKPYMKRASHLSRGSGSPAREARVAPSAPRPNPRDPASVSEAYRQEILARIAERKQQRA